MMGLWCRMRLELRHNGISEVSFITVDKAKVDVCWYTKSKRDGTKEKKQERSSEQSRTAGWEQGSLLRLNVFSGCGALSPCQPTQSAWSSITTVSPPDTHIHAGTQKHAHTLAETLFCLDLAIFPMRASDLVQTETNCCSSSPSSFPCLPLFMSIVNKCTVSGHRKVSALLWLFFFLFIRPCC